MHSALRHTSATVLTTSCSVLDIDTEHPGIISNTPGLNWHRDCLERCNIEFVHVFSCTIESKE